MGRDTGIIRMIYIKYTHTHTHTECITRFITSSGLKREEKRYVQKAGKVSFIF